MPTTTPYYGLALYNNTTDGSSTFIDYRQAQSGTPLTSNMNLIDVALNNIQSQVNNFVQGSVYVSASTGGSNVYSVGGIAAIPSYNVGTGIILSVNAANTGTSTLNINSLGAKYLYKTGASGSNVALAPNDLIPNRFYPFTYSGYEWRLTTNTSGCQINMQGNIGNMVTVSADKSLTSISASNIAVDTFGSPTNNTNLNVSTSAHGLMPILPNDSKKFINGSGSYVLVVVTGSYVATGTDTGGSVVTLSTGLGTIRGYQVEIFSSGSGINPYIVSSSSGSLMVRTGSYVTTGDLYNWIAW